MEILQVDPKTIKPYYSNPRVNHEAVAVVMKSIEDFGFKQPIVVDKKKVIRVGHTRWKASMEMELDEVPVLIASDMSQKQAKAYRIADNKSNQISQWDFTLLRDELLELDDGDFDVTSTAFELEEIERLMTLHGDEHKPKKEEPTKNTGMETISLMVTPKQKKIIETAIADANLVAFPEDDPKVANGSAICIICEAYNASEKI